MKRRAILFFLLFLLQMGSVPTLAAEPTVAAQGAALIDGKTGRLLWGKNADAPLAMASTTKIMTAILVLEQASLTEVVTVSKNAAQQPKVHMSLQEGEQWQAGALLSAMLLRSYNDAAVALAEQVSGDVAKFCAEIEKLHLTADLPKELAAPVHRGERLGQAVLWLGEERLAAVDLLAAEDAEPFTLAQRLLRLAEGWLSWRD